MGEKNNFTHEFVGKGEEDLVDIFKRQFIRFVNTQKGFSYLTLKKKDVKKINSKI